MAMDDTTLTVLTLVGKGCKVILQSLERITAMKLLMLLTLTIALPGCAVIDLVNMCTTTPEACTSGGNTEYIRVDGKTYIVERSTRQ